MAGTRVKARGEEKTKVANKHGPKKDRLDLDIKIRKTHPNKIYIWREKTPKTQLKKPSNIFFIKKKNLKSNNKSQKKESL